MFDRKRKKDEQPNSPARYSDGYDNPLSDPDNDRLGRKRFINQIYPYLTDLESEWSVRVGLLAPWGEGKTTVCRWIAERAKKDGHIPVWLSPWAARTDAQLWAAFYTALDKALKDLGIKVSGFSVSIPGLKKSVSNLTNSELTENIGRLHRTGEAGLKVIQSLIKMSPRDISKLKNNVQGKRFIVIFDDLDRVDSSLIPQLLMALRELLDLPGFSFLLPFDDKIVSHALSKHNASPEFGENFLEKILDFRVRLDRPNSDQVASFFKHEMEAQCPFVPATAMEGLDSYLPSNPRRLKSLVRSVRVFQAEASRHREGEIDWKALIFAQLIRLESDTFFDNYAQDTFADDTDDNSGPNRWFAAAFERNKEKAKTDELNRISSLLDKAGVELEEKRERLTLLCEGWREAYDITGQHKIKYACKLLSQPETLTWAEFDSFWELWSEKKEFAEVSPWFSEQVAKTQEPKDEIVREVLITLAYQYGQDLEKAGAVALRSAHHACVENAKEILTFYNHFLEQEIPSVVNTRVLTVDVFQVLMSTIASWFHFRGNESDRDLRKVEEALLKKWVQTAHELGLSHDYRAILATNAIDYLEDKEDLARLYSELLEIIEVAMVEDALGALKKDEGINEILPSGVGEGIKNVLLNPTSEIWLPMGSSQAEQILLTAKDNPAVQINARNLLDLLQSASDRGTRELRSEQVREFFEHQSLIVAIWNAATATELQFRRLQETRQVRDSLIEKGIAADKLATPDWLLKTRADVEIESTP